MGARQRKIETFFWGKPPASEKERKLLRKLDMVILSYVSLSCADDADGRSVFPVRPHACLGRILTSDWINYLDRANLANAYVSGMREDIGFKGLGGKEVIG